MSEESQDKSNEFESSKDENNIIIKKSSYNNMLKGIVVAIAIATFLGGYAIGTLDNNSDSLSADEIKQIISEIETKSLPSVQPTQEQTQPETPQIIQVSLDDDPVKGDPNAPITIVEFSDFQCPFCSRFYQQTLPQIEEDYIKTGKIKLVYRDMPLDNLHLNARPVHIAAECADEQGKFWQYHDILFEKQTDWQHLSSSDLSTTLTQYAVDLGLQTVSFELCLASEEIANEVNQDYLDGEKYGATGTPTFFIGTEKEGFIKLVGAHPFATFQNEINNQLG